ncbi:MAG: SIR2 family protein [Saprospiraceae bacterium]|nr:SIR2 family protein [Saprospiraceae bacterium]
MMNEQINWDDLLFDIANNRAVLLIGHDLLPHDSESIQQDLHAQLTANGNDHGIDNFYPHDGFFLFRSHRYKISAQKKAADFFKSRQPKEELLQKITEMPFRMVISINPDKSLERAYTRYAAEPQFDYFTWRPNKKDKEITEPSPDLPLVYNLFGSVEHYESLLLDYEDLFDHLKKLLNDENIPDVIRSILNETETYIFLGFRLEKWYTQLLFRYLNRKEHHFDDKNKNYTCHPGLPDDSDTMLFFKKQFNVSCYGATEAFFEELHRRHAERVEQEEDEHPGLSPKEKVSRYIADGKTRHALNVLTRHQGDWNGDDRNALVLLKSNFANYRERLRKRLANEQDLALELRKIHHAILEFSAAI